MLFAALFPVAFCRRKLIRCYCGAKTCCPGEPVGRIGLIGGARDNTFWRDAALPHCSRLSAGDDISCLDSLRLSLSRKSPVNQSNLEISCDWTILLRNLAALTCSASKAGLNHPAEDRAKYDSFFCMPNVLKRPS
jgi:hypothetical protein